MTCYRTAEKGNAGLNNQNWFRYLFGLIDFLPASNQSHSQRSVCFSDLRFTFADPTQVHLLKVVNMTTGKSWNVHLKHFQSDPSVSTFEIF